MRFKMLLVYFTHALNLGSCRIKLIPVMVAFRLRQMSLLHSTSYATHRRPAVQSRTSRQASGR